MEAGAVTRRRVRRSAGMALWLSWCQWRRTRKSRNTANATTQKASNPTPAKLTSRRCESESQCCLTANGISRMASTAVHPKSVISVFTLRTGERRLISCRARQPPGKKYSLNRCPKGKIIQPSDTSVSGGKLRVKESVAPSRAHFTSVVSVQSRNFTRCAWRRLRPKLSGASLRAFAGAHGQAGGVSADCSNVEKTRLGGRISKPSG